MRTAGLNPWSNVYPFLCAPPERQWALHLGPLRSVGVCSFSSTAPGVAATALLTTFGLLPALGVLLWTRGRPAAPRNLLQRFCLLYGGVSFAMAPLIGIWYARLFGYGWPLFLVAAPTLFSSAPAPATSRKRDGEDGFAALCAGCFLLIHGALAMTVLQPSSTAPLAWDAVLELAGVALLLWRPGGSSLASKTD